MGDRNEAGPVALARTEPEMGETEGTARVGNDTASGASSQGASLSPAGTFALGYAKRGWHVFPVRKDKTPLTAHGFLDATTETRQIIEWWRRWPDAGIGVACEPSKLVVADLDVDPTKGKNGIEAWQAKFGDAPHGAALVARTPRGGRHHVYAAVPGVEHASDVDGIARGVDTRAVGGYFIAPSGAPDREWIEGDPIEDDLTPPPTHVLDALPIKGRSEKVISPLPEMTQAEKDRSETASALFAISPEIKRPLWFSAIHAVHAKCDGSAYGAALVEKWSSMSTVGNYIPGEATKIYAAATLPWESTQKRPLVDKGTLFAMARRCGWIAAGIAEDEPEIRIGKPAAAPSSEAEPAPFNPDSYNSKLWHEVAELPQLDWLVDGWIPEKSTGLIGGDPEAGKSFIAIDLMLRLLHGREWFGRRVAKASTLYLAGEGYAGLAGRFRAWATQHSASSDEAGSDYAAVLDGIPPLQKASAKLYAKIISGHVTAYGRAPKLVIIDTFSQGLAEGDENDSKAVVPALRLMAQLRTKYGCAVWAVHHFRKTQRGQAATVTAEDFRGHSSLRGNVDGLIGVGIDGRGRFLKPLKVKDGSKPEQIRFDLLPVDTGAAKDGKAETSCIVIPAAATPFLDATIQQPTDVVLSKLVDSLRSLLDRGLKCGSKSVLVAETKGHGSGNRQDKFAKLRFAIDNGMIVELEDGSLTLPDVDGSGSGSTYSNRNSEPDRSAGSGPKFVPSSSGTDGTGSGTAEPKQPRRRRASKGSKRRRGVEEGAA